MSCSPLILLQQLNHHQYVKKKYKWLPKYSVVTCFTTQKFCVVCQENMFYVKILLQNVSIPKNIYKEEEKRDHSIDINNYEL